MNQVYCWESANVLTNNMTGAELVTIKNNESHEIKNMHFFGNLKRRIFKLPCILTLVIITAVIILTVFTIIFKEKFNNSDNGFQIPFSSALIISDNDTLWIYDVTDSKSIIFQKNNKSINTFDMYTNQTIFLSTKGNSTFSSLSYKYPNVTHLKKLNPQALAVDHISEKLYVIDKSAGTLNVIDMYSKYQNIILSDLKKPHDLALDCDMSLMFIVQSSHSILKANMDGSSLTAIIRSPTSSAITIDRKAQRIYWANDFESIETSNYFGKNRLILNRASIKIESMTILGDRLFWIWPAYWASNATLWSCRISNNEEQPCANQTVHSISFLEPKIIKTFTNLDISSFKTNPCRIANGGCQHMCLLTSGNSMGYSCACTLGWLLNSDLKTCQLVTEFILYTQGNYIRGRIMDDRLTNFVDAIYPVHLHTESLKHKETIDFDYDLNNDDFYFSDDISIFKVNMMRDGEQIRITKCNSESQIKGLVFDWFTGNLYYALRGDNNVIKHKIVILKTGLKQNIEKTLIKFPYISSYTQMNCPYSLIINGGYLYYTKVSSLGRVSLNGTDSLDLYSFDYNINNVKPVALDYNKDEFYLIYSKNGNNAAIHHVTLSGVRLNYYTIKMLSPNSIFVYQNWLYVSNLTSIWRFDKQTGDNATRIIPKWINDDVDADQKISGVKIFSPVLQHSNKENPCYINNGGCEQFCFVAPKKFCDCQDGETIELNGQCN